MDTRRTTIIRKKVLIVGAGLAGISLYLSLNKKKFDVQIIERRPDAHNLGYVITFMPNGVRVLRKLGFSNADITALGKPIHQIITLDENGEQKGRTELASFRKNYDEYLAVERAALYKLFEKKFDSSIIQYNTQPEKIEQHEDHVSVQFTGEMKEHTYDIVVGADGGNSFVRKAIFPDSIIKKRGQFVMWAWLPRKQIQLNNRIMGFDYKDKRGIGYFDIADPERICAFFYAKQKLIPNDITPVDYPQIWYDLLQDMRLDTIQAGHAIPEEKDIFSHEDRTVSLKKLYKESIVLIGDAAHARSVFTGSGTGLALEDGYLLGTYLNTMSVKKAFGSYDKIQRPRARKMVPALGKKFVKIIDAFLRTSKMFGDEK